jgi:hypothetical protein
MKPPTCLEVDDDDDDDGEVAKREKYVYGS